MSKYLILPARFPSILDEDDSEDDSDDDNDDDNDDDKDGEGK